MVAERKSPQKSGACSVGFMFCVDWISKVESKNGRASGEGTHVNSLLGLLSKSLEIVYQHAWI